MKLDRSLILLLLVLFSGLVRAQQYPVQVTVTTTPPYYNFLSYYGDQNNHLTVIATLTDFNTPPINARLRLRIEGPGYVLRTHEDVPVGNAFTLTPGFPVFIQGSDLLSLLQPQSFVAVLGSPDLNNLPEGFTTVCAELIEEGAQATVISNSVCSPFFLQFMQPPQPQLPFCNSTADTNALFQTFQWSPPQNYVPSIGTELSYTFSLYEWIDTTNFNIFQTGQGLVYAATTQVPIVQVSNFDVAWQKGRKYIWRVQAQLAASGQPVQMITQQGLSQPCSFYYGKPVSIAESLAGNLTIQLSAEALTSRKGRASWTVTDDAPGVGISTYASYIVNYRRKPNESEQYNYSWRTDTVPAMQLPIYQLEPGVTYQVRVAGIAGNYVSEPTEITEFTTPATRDYACGEADMPYFSPNFQPLASAHLGDILQIGQFPLLVTYIQPLGAPGRFSGRGLIAHDFIGGAKIKVKFDNLLIDSDYNVREGAADAMTDGVDSWLNDQYLDLAGVDTTLSGVIESGGFLNDTTVFVVVGGDSLFFTFNGDLPIVIHGAGNVEYQFWPNGTMVVTNYGVIPSGDHLDATKDIYVSFEADPDQQYGFDAKQYDHFSTNYEGIICSDQSIYFVPNKSKAQTGTETVRAVIHGTIQNYTPSEMEFRIAGSATLVPHSQINDSTFLLTLPAQSANYSVYAVYADFKYGKLNVKCYEPKVKKVTIVPLMAFNYTEAQIEAALNEIYKGANLAVDATLAAQFNTAEFTATTTFANPDAAAMTKYTAQMRLLRDAYLQDHQVASGNYLLFVIPSFENSQLDGYMVRGRGVGFVAQSSITTLSAFTHTLAHELGHGIGGLLHSWGEQTSLKGVTDNLMDYSSGTRLIKDQWEGLRDPGLTLSLLDSEEDGSNYTVTAGNLDTIYSSFANRDGTITFIDPSGRAITLPPGLMGISFASPDSYWTETGSGDTVSTNVTPIGSLLSFKLANGDEYYNFAEASNQSQRFLGYKKKGTADFYPNNLTPADSIRYVLAGIPCLINGFVKFKICPMNLPAVLANGLSEPIIGGNNVPEERFKFLNDYFTSTSDANGELVVATFSTQIPNQVLQYLQSVRADIVGKEAVYAFQAAYLLQANEIAGACIAGINNATQLVIDAERQHEVIIEQEANFNRFNTQVSDNPSLQLQQNLPPMEIRALDYDPQIFQSQVEYGEDPEYFKKFYYSVANWVDQINNLHSYSVDALSGQNIDIGSYSDFIFEQLRSDQRSCYLSSLTARQRVKILREYSEWTWGSQKERLFLEVLETTPESQYTEVLDGFKEDNYALLKGLNGDLWSGDNARLFMDVSWMVIKNNNVNIYDIPQPTIGYDPNNLPIPYIILQKEETAGVRIEIDPMWQPTGTILFTYKWRFDAKSQTPNTQIVLDPYDMVIVRFEDDYQFAGIDGLQIRKGDRFRVPAMFAYWLLLEQDKIDDLTTIRFILDIAAITASIVTVNPGPFLIVDGIIGAIDLGFTLSQDDILSSGTPHQKEVLRNWDAFATIVGVANGAYLITKTVGNTVTFAFDRAAVLNRVRAWKAAGNPLTLEEARGVLRTLYKNSTSNIFQSGYNTLKQELSAVMREIEINRIMVDQDAGILAISETTPGLVRLTHPEAGNSVIDLCYLNPDAQGRVCFENLQFIDNNPSLIDQVLMELDHVNYKNAAGELKTDGRLSVVKTKTGVVKVVVGRVEMSMLNYLATHADMQLSIQTIAELKAGNLLQLPTGSANDLELAVVHRYTLRGNILNDPMRNGSEVVIGTVTFSTYQSELYHSLLTAMDKLRQTNRHVTGTVIRGRTYSLADYNALFNSGNVNVPLKAFVSCTHDINVAIGFLETTGSNIVGPKIKVILKIKSKNGVYIDDLSDWGVNLVNDRHPNNPVQQEVFLMEGYFKQTAEPKKILNPDGTHKKDSDGTQWFEVELEELGTPLRNIN